MRFLFLCLGPVWADQVPPDYGEVLAREAASALEELNAKGVYHEVVRRGDAFGAQVLAAAEVEYEVAVAWSALGDATRAERRFRRAVELDPDHAASWYDLGELLLRQGDLREAEEAFRRAAALRPDHWAGFFRLAEVAARRGQAERFEAELRAALRAGFTFRMVIGDANWLGYYRDPALRDVFRRLVTVYSDERLLEAFEQEAAIP